MGAPTVPLHVPAEHARSWGDPGVAPEGATTTVADCVVTATYAGLRVSAEDVFFGTVILIDSVDLPTVVGTTGEDVGSGAALCGAIPPPAHADSATHTTQKNS